MDLGQVNRWFGFPRELSFLPVLLKHNQWPLLWVSSIPYLHSADALCIPVNGGSLNDGLPRGPGIWTLTGFPDDSNAAAL